MEGKNGEGWQSNGDEVRGGKGDLKSSNGGNIVESRASFTDP